MKEAIERFCKAQTHGLFLLDMPTGFGKTHSVLEFIADNYDNEEYAGTRFFFITTQKKNLPYNQLKEMFAKKGKEDFDKRCIQIDSNAETVIQKLVQLHKQGKIPKRVTQTHEFVELFRSICVINEYRDKKSSARDDKSNGYCKSFEELVAKTQEPALREVIYNDLSKYRSSKDKLKAIANEEDYHWIGELYPAVYTREKQIFFMSVDKFYLGNTTIIEPTYSFSNNKIIDDAIIFVDEFDSTKDRILNQIIRRGIDNYVDYITLFTQIESTFKTKQFPEELTTDSKQRLEVKKQFPRTKLCADILTGVAEVVDDTFGAFSMQYSFKTENNDAKDIGRNFIFNDLQYHSILSGKNSFAEIVTDKKAKQNWIRFTDHRPADDKSGLLDMLANVKGSITYFQNGCRKLSFNYKNLQDERRKLGDYDFTVENAASSILREFYLAPDQRRYLYSCIMSGIGGSKKDVRDMGKLSLNGLDRSVYDKGFRYYDFVDNPNHNMQSIINVFDFRDSPEKVLLQMSERARVIGVSATATLDTVVGNYDMEYLQNKLHYYFYELPVEDEKRLRTSFEDFTKDYANVDIRVEAVSYVDDYNEDLKEVFQNPTLVKKYKEKLENKFYGKYKFAAANFLRIIKVLKAFICNDGIQSFLCMSNKLPQDDKISYDLKLVKEFATDIIREAKKQYKAETLIVCLNGEEYDSQYAKLIARLSNGEKLFVLSSYYTVGAGQNLQYKKPDNVEVVEVNKWSRGDMEKDFDGIYLEKPTNLIVNVDSHNSITNEELVRFIYQMEFMMERGEISRKDGIARIKDAFNYYSGGYSWSGRKSAPYETLSVNNFAIRTLIQAVGRICRTGLKNKEIYIYVDEDIFKKYNLSQVESRILNPEFRAIVEYTKNYGIAKSDENEVARLENIAGQQSIKAMQIINDLKREWDDDSIEYWRQLRQLCLMCPTMHKNQVNKNPQFKIIYMRAPKEISKYSYTQEGDYNKNITVKFDDSLSQKMSEGEVNLQELFTIPGLKDFFVLQKYATTFIPSEYILTPPMYNNIYKGALGEAVGKYVFEKFLQVKLEEMPDEFYERFDYTVGDGIYIDFKLWKETMRVDAKKARKKILEKLEEVNGRKAIIVNIIGDRNAYPITSCEGRIIEIPYLYRIDRHELGKEMLFKIKGEGYLE